MIPDPIRRDPQRGSVFEIAAIGVAATILFLLFGHWRFGSIGPAGFSVTPDELYMYEWIADARQGHFPSALPFGQLYPIMLFGFTRVVEWFKPDAMALANCTSTLRLLGALLWAGFARYSLTLGVRRLWLAVMLVNPVVVYMAFNYAKPDFLCFACSLLGFLHWLRFLRTDRRVDLYASAIFLGAGLAAKASAVLTIPFYVLSLWAARRELIDRRLLYALLRAGVVLVAAVVIGSPRYMFVGNTLRGLMLESRISRLGFPGANAYPGYYWILILALSFPIELILSCLDYSSDSRLRRTMAVSWIVGVGVFALLVRHELPMHLLPLVAVLGALGLDREPPGKGYSRSAATAVVLAAILFSSICLRSKLSLNFDFPRVTSYGRAAAFIERAGITPTPLSEIVFGQASLQMPAHFWRPDVVDAVLNSLRAPQLGYYLLASDTYIKATVSPRQLDDFGRPYVFADQYAQAVRSFVDASHDHSIWAETHDATADKLFFEIHVDGYWPWRELLARIRGEMVAPGTSISIYRY